MAKGEKFNLALIIIVAALFVTLSCTSSGRQIDKDNLGKVQKGLTTQDEIQQMFGKPESVRTDSNGNSSWHYQYSSASDVGGTALKLVPIPGVDYLAPSASSEVQMLTFQFNPKKVVTNFNYSESKK